MDTAALLPVIPTPPLKPVMQTIASAVVMLCVMQSCLLGSTLRLSAAHRSQQQAALRSSTALEANLSACSTHQTQPLGSPRSSDVLTACGRVALEPRVSLSAVSGAKL